MCFEGGSDEVAAGTGLELIFQSIDDDPVIGVQPDRDPLLLRLTFRRLPSYSPGAEQISADLAAGKQQAFEVTVDIFDCSDDQLSVRSPRPLTRLYQALRNSDSKVNRGRHNGVVVPQFR